MTQAIVRKKKRRLSLVWVVPFLALALGAGVILKSMRDQGPAVEVRFATAEGLKAGETAVKRLSVELGRVESVELDADGKGVIATLRLDPSAADFLREGTDFWVVRPRVGAGGVSGLSTLLSGGYVELSPGAGDPGARTFVGLDRPPRISKEIPGLELTLIASDGTSMGIGSPILYHGIRVGEVESVELNVTDNVTRVHAFVEAPYDQLVVSQTQFWNASGLRVSTGTSGLSLQTESLEALIAGGIAFSTPEDIESPEAVSDGHEFDLHISAEAAQERSYKHKLELLLMFDCSVRGLAIGAPVEYRGLQTGSVVDISFDLVPRELRWNAESHALIPVLIQLEPGRVDGDSAEEVESLRAFLGEAVGNGLRAQLSTGSLLTGSLYVNLDFHPTAVPAALRELGEFTVLPTIRGGISQIQDQVSSVLTMIEETPIEELMESVDRAVTSVADLGNTANGTVSDLRELITDPDLRSLPKELGDVITALDGVLAGFAQDGDAYRQLMDTLQTARGAIEGLSPGSDAYAQLGQVMQSAKATLDGLSPDSAAYAKIVQALSAVRLTVQDASRLLGTLDERPSRILFSGSRDADPVPGSKR